jgi:hypothetical protein
MGYVVFRKPHRPVELSLQHEFIKILDDKPQGAASINGMLVINADLLLGTQKRVLKGWESIPEYAWDKMIFIPADYNIYVF